MVAVRDFFGKSAFAALFLLLALTVSSFADVQFTKDKMRLVTADKAVHELTVELAVDPALLDLGFLGLRVDALIGGELIGDEHATESQGDA